MDRKNEYIKISNTTYSIPLTKGMFAIIDTEDLDTVNKYYWHAKKATKTYYAIAYDTQLNRLIRMHRLILNLVTSPRNIEVDHIDMNGLNNCKSNLRIATHSENNHHRTKVNRSGITSQFIGVRFHKFSGLWHARIRKDGKEYSLGYFREEKEAANAYNIAAIKYYGEFASLNPLP